MQFSVAESKLVSENVGIEPVLPERRQRKRKQFADESVQDDNEHINCGQEDHFRNNVYYVLMDNVIGNSYDSIYALESMFGFLWKYLNTDDSEVEERPSSLRFSILFLLTLSRRYYISKPSIYPT